MFEEWLIDHETACNVGNWQWLSCTAFYSMYYRMYSPIAFGQKWDPEGTFVRKYVPELKDLNKKYIYEPWKAPKAELREANVEFISEEDVMGELGKQKNSAESKSAGKGKYPRPIFDFAERRNFCLDAMKKAYAVNLYGNDPKVLDGGWKELFEDTKTAKTNKSKVTADHNEGGEEGDNNAGGKKEKKRETGYSGWAFWEETGEVMICRRRIP